MPDYNDQFQPEQSNTLTKAIAGMATTMVLFGAFQAGATALLKGSGVAALKSLRKLPSLKGGLANLRKASLEDTDAGLWSLLKGQAATAEESFIGKIGAFAKSWDEKAAEGAHLREMLHKGWRARKAVWGRIQRADRDSRLRIAKSVGFDYLKHFSYEAPMFYVGEKTIGILDHDTRSHQQQKDRAWYNLPGHAWDFIKYVPSFAAIDIAGRAAMSAMPVAASYLMRNVVKKTANSPTASIVADALGKASAFLPKADELVHRTTAAYKYAYRHTGGESGYGILLHRDPKTTAGYRINKNPIDTLYRRIKLTQGAFRSYKHKALDRSKISTVHRIHLHNERGEFVGSDLDKFLAGLDINTRVGRRTEDALYRATTQPGRTPVLARILGLVHANLRHVRQADASLYDSIYKDLLKTSKEFSHSYHRGSRGGSQQVGLQFIWGAKPGTPLKDITKSHLDLLYREGVFYDPRRNKLVDLSNITPRSLVERVAYTAGRLLSFGHKFDTTALFQTNLLRHRSPNIIISADQHLINPRALKEQYKSMGPEFRFSGTRITDSNENTIPGMALYIRRPGDKGHALYGMRNRPDGIAQYEQLTKSELGLLPTRTTAKLINVLSQKYKQFINPQRKPDAIERLNKDSLYGKARTWLYDKLNLFGGDGLHPSGLEILHGYVGPGSLKRLFNKQRNPILRKYGFDIKNYKKAGALNEAEDFLTLSEAALYSISRKANLIQRREVFDEFLKPIKNDVEQDVFDQLRLLGTDNIIGDADVAFQALSTIITKGNRDSLETTLGYSEMSKLYNQITKSGSKQDLYAVTGEEVPDKIRRFIAQFRMNSLRRQGPKMQKQLTLGTGASVDGTLAQRITHITNNLIGSTATAKDKAMVDMLILGSEFRHTAGNKSVRELAAEESERIGELLKLLKNADDAGILENFSNEIGRFVKYRMPDAYRNDMFSTSSKFAAHDPYVPVHKDVASAAELVGLYAYDTFGQALDMMGLGWNRAKYADILPHKTESGQWAPSVVGLWAKRAAYAGVAALGYRALDTFFDVNPMFDGTALDEGLTVAAADQLVNARLLTASIFDIAGITDAAKYMEGLMPKSTSIIPGAAVGFLMGGVPGAMAGAIVNRYTNAQVSGGPLSAASIILPIAPLVADLTKSREELESIYSGETRVPSRKGRGWTLGTTPIEGGRVSAYTQNWYAKLKSQYKASPTLYGSKVEEFIFKDLPFIDFSIGDLINPSYLQNKHRKDRPYVIGDTPFSETPIVGPVLGATAGRLYNAVHPFGTNSPIRGDEAAQNLTSGVISDTQKQMYGYGGLYDGAPVLGIEGSPSSFGQPIPGHFGEYTHGEVASPNDTRQLISEQVYRGFIEPAGLTGFATSAMLWGGDEPYTDQPVFASAEEMDSFRRDYWDRNLGDMFMLNEAWRRLFPRPRTSMEKVNPLHNEMPGWMPDEYKMGDPYCLLPDTMVEVEGGLERADAVEQGDLIRTGRGQFYPVHRVATHMVDEEIYVIRLTGLPFDIKVTADHPFMVNKKWIQAKDLSEGDKATYPLLHTNPQNVIQIRPDIHKPAPITPSLARMTALLLCSIRTRNDQYMRFTGPYRRELEKILKDKLGLFPEKTNRYKNKGLLKYVDSLLHHGLPVTFYSLPLIDLIQFLHPFYQFKDNTVSFNMPTVGIGYQIWSMLLPFGYVGSLDETGTVHYYHKAAHNLATMFGETVFSYSANPYKDKISLYYDVNTTSFSAAFITIESIRTEHYTGPVYGFEVDRDDSFCVPGAATHNTKIPEGEALLPGAGYEALNDVTIDFPTGPSSLGKSAYTQALQMIGLHDPTDDRAEAILEEGTRTHRIIQDMLAGMNSRVRSEAFIFDAEHDIKAYVDVLVPDRSARGGYRPIEIKTIGSSGFDKLKYPKFSHQTQLNTYLNILNEQQGTLLYVDRDDPTRIKTFDIQYDPALYRQTIDRLEQARSMARKFLSEGYGTATEGYSYLDRAKVLLNADPFSTQFKEAWKIVKKKAEVGLLTEKQFTQYEQLDRQYKSMMWQEEMYPLRFQASKILSPDHQYNNYSLNENIKAAAEYGPLARIAGSVWEYGTHLRSPLHSKLFGLYSPEEQYERNVLYGRNFKSWTKPYDHWIEPYSRGLKSVTDPVQGGISWGLGGMVLGGPVLASLTTPIGALYGALHGAYRAVTGSRYIPDYVKERGEMAEYFDRISYDRAHRMYLATRDGRYQKEMERTSIGWAMSGIADEGLRRAIRHQMNAKEQGIGTDQGFGSKWRGLSQIKKLAPEVLTKSEAAVVEATKMNLYGSEKELGALRKYFKRLFRRADQPPKHRIYNTLNYNDTVGPVRGLDIKKSLDMRIGIREPVRIQLSDPQKTVDMTRRTSRTLEQMRLKYFDHANRLVEGPAAKLSRRVHNPYALQLGPDKGFGSPWKGTDTDYTLGQDGELPRIGNPETDLYAASLTTAIPGLPHWDKPYFFPFLTAPTEDRSNILSMVDPQMKMILKKAWGMQTDIPNMDADMGQYFEENNKYRPTMIDQINNPNIKQEDVELRTIEASGYDAHDFGLGWRQQQRRINNSPHNIQAIDVNGETAEPLLTGMDQGDIRQMIMSALATFGIQNAKIDIRELNGSEGPTHVNLLVTRDRSNINFINGLSLYE